MENTTIENIIFGISVVALVLSICAINNVPFTKSIVIIVITISILSLLYIMWIKFDRTSCY